jgi:ABC-type multidrug transport system ATPase subunit
MGFLWQQPSRNLVPYLSVWDNVELPMLLTGQPAQERRDWVQELLEAVGLWERRTHSVHQLSGGEQQRTAIAVALANKPILLLADEPTGEVDSVTAQQIFATIHNLNQTYDLTVVVVTHDVRISDQVDRVVSIRDGKTSSERFRRVYESAEEAIYGEGAVAGEESLDQGVSYHEYVVVDAAGRLQIPKEFIEELGIRGLVELERVDGGILVKPAKDAEHLSTHAERAAAAMDQWSNADESPLASNTVVRAGQQIWQAITRRK